MSDYKVIVTNGLGDGDSQHMADAIVDKHGLEYDEPLGDFVVGVSGQTIAIIVRNVADGDVRMLVADLLEEHGDVEVAASKAEAGNWFPIDLEEE